MPEPAAYGCDTMKEKDRADFFKWYEQQNGPFKMAEELDKYCVQVCAATHTYLLVEEAKFSIQVWLTWYCIALPKQ